MNHTHTRFSSALAGVCAVAFAASLSQSALATDAAAMGWGENAAGAVGDGTANNNRLSPVFVNDLGSGVQAVAAGADHSVAIHNGAAMAWGNDGYGQLGNGAGGSSNTPIAVSGLDSGVTVIAAGANHNLAIHNGVLVAWGQNLSGQLGDGNAGNSQQTPVTVVSMETGVSDIAGGMYFSLAIKDGGAWAWGSNTNGELGNGSNIDSLLPVQVSGLDSGVTAIAGGLSHAYAIHNGAAVAWGSNSASQLGDGSGQNQNTPVPVAGLDSGVTDISAGAYFGLAIKDGNVYAWGDNTFGNLGDGTTTPKSTPVLVLDLDVDIIQVAAGYTSSYALAADGTLWVWGDNGHGQLGLGDTDERHLPQQLLAPDDYHFTAIGSNCDARRAIAIVTTIKDCPADLDASGNVDVSDLLVLLGAWGPCNNCPADINGDGTVDVSDLLELLGAWGDCS